MPEMHSARQIFFLPSRRSDAGKICKNRSPLNPPRPRLFWLAKRYMRRRARAKGRNARISPIYIYISIHWGEEKVCWTNRLLGVSHALIFPFFHMPAVWRIYVLLAYLTKREGERLDVLSSALYCLTKPFRHGFASPFQFNLWLHANIFELSISISISFAFAPCSYPAPFFFALYHSSLCFFCFPPRPVYFPSS